MSCSEDLSGNCRKRSSRRKLLDRMIAAQALVHRATLVTFNPDDFSDVPWSLVAGVAIEVAENVLDRPVSGAQPLSCSMARPRQASPTHAA